MKEAEKILQWVAEHALPSGVLAEQLNPSAGEPLSVSPLTWSHGTYVGVTQQYLRRMAAGKGVVPDREQDWIGRLFGSTCESIHGLCRVPGK